MLLIINVKKDKEQRKNALKTNQHSFSVETITYI